jgi:amidase
MGHSESWQETAKRIQEYRDGTIAQIATFSLPETRPLNVVGVPRKVLTEKECIITEKHVEDLAVSLATGVFTATETVDAYLRRAALAQKLVRFFFFKLDPFFSLEVKI